jgi:hypothetical protein
MYIVRKEVKLILVMTLVVTFLGTSIVFSAGPKAVRKYPIPENGTLELNVPTSWRGDIHKPQENLPPTIIFGPTKGNDFQVLITVLWDNVGEPDFNSPEKVRALVEIDGKKILPKAVETKIVLREIRGPNNTGYFFSLTDKAHKPGEFRYMTRGGMTVGNLLLNVTILHRIKESGSIKDGLSMLREAKQSAK